MDANIILISKEQQTAKLLEQEIIDLDLTFLKISENCKIVDANSLVINDKFVFFDYLIIQDNQLIDNLNLESEGNKVITNYFLQTNIENFFALTPCNNCEKSLAEQIATIIEYIKEPF